ncbi:Vms1/Ankzf1 family peptidyl-tRNA hydrolase [Natrialbaceae archaeon AArc-T1-2]|uniref:Vms1/Ankzf1 family peptidyl-tRNA hydrolase n=1 Tax=Natrialbaceae archaeon AArc-T1-2 TaxID=3053904 RepID=UPI00255B2C7C|nr:Vms1/Ankzf1 family peptidyl-tRNA hydrolase [Natrialbaceae archaeon AArc-T1-2]WIV68502.1 Vms1/Ankzf1 family peptidyl-tRNA hydrolase [Natrialbaceae archaeon AArc-T1-2]
MLDELLGRAPLKERIDELEEETERLRRRYEAESERRAEAVTARQEAEERVNRLEDRIAQLEGELDRLEDDDRSLEVRRRERLRGERLEAVLSRLESLRTAPEGALTATIDAADEVPDGAAEILGERSVLLEEATPCLCCLDDAGIVSVALDPPVGPDLEAAWSDRFELERAWFQPTGPHAVALVRTDLFALGVYEGTERVDYRGFESDVKGAHSKGGFSQARFERIRDEQIDDHLERVHEVLAPVEADRLYLVGQRGVVDTVAETADPDATAAVDATGDPESALEDAVRSFWTTDVRVL